MQDNASTHIRRNNKTVETHVIKKKPPEELNWILLILKIALWIVLFLLCLEMEFGAIFVIISAFYLIFTNFRNGQRQSWEPSAYSVIFIYNSSYF